MDTYFHLVRGANSESYSDFKDRIYDCLNSIINQSHIQNLKITLTEAPPPAISTIPFGKTKIAAIKVVSSSNEYQRLVKELDGYSGGYLVEEALPVAYKKEWANGEATPGVCLLTLFRKRKDIDYETFIERWHHGHTPLSLKIHPLWHYSRNVVKEVLDGDSEPHDGIVEEHCETRSELLNPAKFFGGPLMMVPNMLKVYFDVKSFLDYPTIEPFLVKEYYLK